jgi:hypothetical protein
MTKNGRFRRGRCAKSGGNAGFCLAHAREVQKLTAASRGVSAQLAMPATSVSSGEPTAEPAVETVGGPAVETMDEPAMETVAEAMVEMRKSSCHHASYWKSRLWLC